MKIKTEFDFEEAKTGTEVTTSNDNKIEDFTFLPSVNCFVGTIDGIIFLWNSFGRHSPENEKHYDPEFNLMMKKEAIAKYAIVYYSPTADNYQLMNSALYSSFEDAREASKISSLKTTVVKIEFVS
jgi:hypothetical protein